MRLAAFAAVLTVPLLAAVASAAPDPAFTLTVPERCIAGSCRVTVTYVAVSAPVVFAVDWDNAGTPDVAFRPGAVMKCLPAADCSLTSPVYTTSGTHTVAVGVAGASDQRPAFSTQTVQVAAGAGAGQPGSGPVDSSASPQELCASVLPGEQCGPGNGRQTAGGGALVSHAGWPAVTGILWKVLDSANHSKTGGAANDELLGHHGSDKLYGGGGKDILWGDWDPRNNNTRQHDLLVGAAGMDWIYPSHGTNIVRAGAGNDHVIAYYGHGTIDCGPGKDIAQVRTNGAYRLRGCEHVVHFCQFGSTSDGTCKKPGGARLSAASERLSAPDPDETSSLP